MNEAAAVRCPLCGSAVDREQFRVKGHRVMQCGLCGLFSVDPYPRPDSRVEAVRHYDFGHKVSNADSCYEAEARTQESSFRLIERHLGGAATLLDIGCGSGYLLERLTKETGLRTRGLELNPDRARLAEQRSGRPIIQVPIEQYLEAERFDVITLMDVFSHVFSLPRLFESVTTHLTERGKLIMKTGELASGVRRGDVRSWEIQDHLQWLGLTTMDFVCRTYGFRTIAHQRLPLAESLFTRQRFLAPGRSRVRDAVKRIAAHTPLALRAARAWYTLSHGCRVYNSFFVLERSRLPGPPLPAAMGGAL